MLTPNSQKLSFLFTSDEHGYISAQSKLQGRVRQAREENPEGTLLISCGDVFEGSSETGVLGVQASADMVEAAGYDVMTLGNHDFDRGAATTRAWVDNAPCPVLVSNVSDTVTGKALAGTAPSRIFDLNHVKVGLVGVTTQETVSILPKAKLEGLAISDPTAAVKAEVAKLREQGAQVIGLISHLGLSHDREMAQAVPELNFILGGHTHDFLETAEQVGGTTIAHAGCFRQALGQLDLEVDATTGSIASVDYHLRRPEANEGPVADNVSTLAHKVSAQVDAEMGKVVAHTERALGYDPNVLGDDMESVMQAAMLERTHADLVLVNQKGLRAGLPAGDITLGHLYNVFPFDNQVQTVNLQVGDVLAVEEESFRRLDQTSLTLGSDRGAVAMDVASHDYQMIRHVPSDELVGSGLAPLLASDVGAFGSIACPLPKDAKMEVATIDFLLQGGLKYFKEGLPVAKDFGSLREMVVDHMRTTYPLSIPG